MVWKAIKVHDEYHQIAKMLASNQGVTMGCLMERLLLSEVTRGTMYEEGGVFTILPPSSSTTSLAVSEAK